jgi:hypothetical protein
LGGGEFLLSNKTKKNATETKAKPTKPPQTITHAAAAPWDRTVTLRLDFP